MRQALSAASRSILGTTYYHDFIPLLKRYRHHLLTKEIPTPSQGSVVPFGERHHTIFEGVEIDDGTKYIIKNMTEEELNHPVKWLDKVKTLYDKVISKLEEERKRKLESANQQALARGNTSSFTGQRLASLLPSSQRNPYDSPSASASSSPFANTPSGLRVPLATIQSPSPLKPTSPPQVRTKSWLSRNGDGGDDDGDGSQINQQLFPLDENSTPTSSPTRSPNGVAPKSKNNNTAPFSPMRPLPPYY
jgi:hypothetical protein